MERLRCNLCGEIFTAPAPEEAGGEQQRKYDETAAAMMATLRYGGGMPLNRLKDLEASLGIPLPASTQWGIVEEVAQLIQPAHDELIRQAASLAARRYELVDPAKRLVARELEGRWNTALERVDQLERRIRDLETQALRRPAIDRAGLMVLAHDLPTVWNAPSADARTKQRLTRILIQEVVIDLDDEASQVVLAIHWSGGRHTEVRVARVRTGRYPDDRHPSPVEVMRKLGGHWPDRELAVTLNRMRSNTADGKPWTVAGVRQLRERLGIAAFDPAAVKTETITVDETAHRLNVCVGSVKRLIREGVLPATQLMRSAPWQIPVAALDTETVKVGVRAVIERRPRNVTVLQDLKTLKLPGF